MNLEELSNLKEKDKCKYLFKVIHPDIRNKIATYVCNYDELIWYLKQEVNSHRREHKELKCLKDYRMKFDYDLEQLVNLVKAIEEEKDCFILFHIYCFERTFDII